MYNSKEIELIGVRINKINLISLINEIKCYYSEIYISVKIKKDKCINDMNINEFENYDFTNNKIDKIEIIAHGENRNMFNFEKDLFGNGYKIKFSARDKNSLNIINGAINDWINKISYFNKAVKFIYSIWIYFIVALFSIIPAIILSIKYYALIEMIICLSLFALFVSVILFPFLFRLLIPKVEIDIGYNQYKIIRHFIWGLITIVILPIIFSILF